MGSASEELKTSRERLFSLFAAGELRESFQDQYSELMDHYFRRNLGESRVVRRLHAEKRPYAFVALGGYGRKELCYHSDIDIMILFDAGIPAYAEGLVEEIFYPLWDLGLDLGYGMRSFRDCMDLAGKDFQVLTATMDARFIGGSSPLFLDLHRDLRKRVIAKRALPFLRWIEAQNRSRLATFGDASYLLEPNLKEGIGGLREYHVILWLARVFFQLRLPRDLETTGRLSHREYDALEKNLRFILLARNHLHQLSGRKNDRLVFEYQAEIARRLGFRDQRNFLAVEQFLGALHAAMAAVKSLRRSFVIGHLPPARNRGKAVQARPLCRGLEVLRGEITFPAATDILSDPILLMEIFEKSASLGYPLSLEARRLVREFLYLVDEPLRKSERAFRSFLRIIGHPAAFETLDQMFETGFLETYIPEFKDIRDRIQFDAYHIYPVGRHALQTLRNLTDPSVEKGLLLVDILSELPDPEPLFLATLFHDIGKTGKGHSPRGAAVTRKILKRFGYGEKGLDEAVFLVRRHLILAEAATRRDLNDEKAVVQCARIIGDTRRLKMLYLLTWADSEATGPKAWNEWIANLVEELFFKILHILERGELATPDAGRRVRKTSAEVRRLIGDRIGPADLLRLFDAMSPRYLLETPPPQIVRHLEMIEQSRESCGGTLSDGFCMEARENEPEACWEVTVLARDRPGLFSDIAGVLALNNINILSAHIYTWRDGTAADIFRVTAPLDPARSEEIWRGVERNLGDTLKGKLPLSLRLEKKGRPSILSRPTRPPTQPKIRIDRDTSDFFTLVEVFADDRVGRLYQITRALFDLNLDIRIAKISTKGDQIADVFYVHDLEGRKVEDDEGVEKIRQALLRLLEQGLPESSR